jgi:hypothetical protein
MAREVLARSGREVMSYEDDQDEIVESAREIESLRAELEAAEAALAEADSMATSIENRWWLNAKDKARDYRIARAAGEGE